jgi:hypothetical protein
MGHLSTGGRAYASVEETRSTVAGIEAILEMVMFPQTLLDKLFLMKDDTHKESVIAAYLELVKDIIREAASGATDPTGVSSIFHDIVEHGRNTAYYSGGVTLYVRYSARERSAEKPKFEIVEFNIDAR